MPKPAVLVLTGYGINCDEETRYAFERAGAVARIVHINDIIATPAMMANFQMAAFPGGFSYGDDTGSGKALANRVKNNLIDEFGSFIERDTLMLGICNGFQVMANLGIVPGLEAPIGSVQVSLERNTTARYQCRWVDLAVGPGNPSVFLKGMKRLHVPVAHGEGNFYASPGVLTAIEEKKLVALRYVRPDGSPAGGEFPYNPNGSVNDIAAISDASGRILGMMPHPERNILFTQRDDWTLERERAKREGTRPPEESEGMALFKNAVGYFK
ncbi:MAG: phosphoribosylformylglycinamidine synthase subunit PurQ [Spirochaetes bacterium]|jgi:phosphoribosylformylglycinamidine synthase|nr:phosphoribosylformylglycinamidine synthase subunit PurQ [Spirochaetota bacterium]